MAHKKAGGSTVYGRDSESKRLGVKIQDGDYAKLSSIIIRQRGNKYRAGKNVAQGKDDTLFASAAGTVKFSTKKIRKYDNRLVAAKFVSVTPQK